MAAGHKLTCSICQRQMKVMLKVAVRVQDSAGLVSEVTYRPLCVDCFQHTLDKYYSTADQVLEVGS
jgi:hypothetical protein